MADDSSEQSSGIPTHLYAQPATCHAIRRSVNILTRTFRIDTQRIPASVTRCTLTVVRMNAITCGLHPGPRLYFPDLFFSFPTISESAAGTCPVLKRFDRPTFLRYPYQRRCCVFPTPTTSRIPVRWLPDVE